MMHLLAQLSDMATPVSILFGTNAALTGALVALYRDCRNDREKLWTHVKELENRINRSVSK